MKNPELELNWSRIQSASFQVRSPRRRRRSANHDSSVECYINRRGMVEQLINKIVSHKDRLKSSDTTTQHFSGTQHSVDDELKS